jgi:hypothetical protein
LRSAVWEQHTLATTEVNNAELITEAVVTIQNSNVGTHYGVHHFIVTEFVLDPKLTKDSIRLQVDRRNAAVSDYSADGSRVKRYYDAEGNLTRELSLGAAPEPPQAPQGPSTEANTAAAPRRAWLPLSGLSAGAGLALLAIAGRAWRRT